MRTSGEEKRLDPNKGGQAEEWERWWTLVLACFFGFSFFSIMTASMSVFMGPLGKEFGWSRTLLSSGITIAAVTTAVLSPFVGMLIDKYGSRWVAMPGLVATIFAISAFSLANGSPMQWLLLWGFYAVISISVKTTVWTAAVANSFNAAQGLALGITLCGTAAAQTILPPLANWLIDEFGWRTSYIILGCGWGGITLLLCYVFLYDAHDRAAAQSKQANAKRARPDLPGLTLAQAWKDSALWRIAISTLVMMILTIGLLIHQIEVLTEAGVSRTNAAWLASLAGIAGIAGKLVTGVLLDRYRANWVGGLTLAATTFAFALLIDGIRSPTLVVIAMAINGYTFGCKLQIGSYLTARYAGMKNFGTIYGVVTSLVALGSGLGPMIAGLVYDTAGDYTAFLVAGAIGSVLCGLLILTLPRYPEWGAKPAPASPAVDPKLVPDRAA